MDHFLKSLHSTRGVLIIFLVLAVSLFVLPMIFEVLSLGLVLFTGHALLTTPSRSIGWKIFLWTILALLVAALLWEIIYNYIVGPGNNALIGFGFGFALIISIPLLLIGLAGLFKSEQSST